MATARKKAEPKADIKKPLTSGFGGEHTHDENGTPQDGTVVLEQVSDGETTVEAKTGVRSLHPLVEHHDD